MSVTAGVLGDGVALIQTETSSNPVRITMIPQELRPSIGRGSGRSRAHLGAAGATAFPFQDRAEPQLTEPGSALIVARRLEGTASGHLLHLTLPARRWYGPPAGRHRRNESSATTGRWSET